MSCPRLLSAVVTTHNSMATLGACLDSLAFCDEILVLDSGSADATVDFARERGACVFIEPFRGYAAQKQRAVDLASNDWVLLLDSDEWLEAGASAVLRATLEDMAGDVAGFSLRRREWLFWRWQHPRSRHNRYVRLFDRRRARLSHHVVHETVIAEGRVIALPVLLMHRGDADIAAKIDKANRYSSLQQPDIARRDVRGLQWRMLLYPHVAFLRYYLLRGHWREGWAGFVAARVHAFYAFAKYAKAYGNRQQPDSTACPTAACGASHSAGAASHSGTLDSPHP